MGHDWRARGGARQQQQRGTRFHGHAGITGKNIRHRNGPKPLDGGIRT
jgi:hypothetical protein